MTSRINEAFETKDHTGVRVRFWRVYICKSCGGLVSAAAGKDGLEITEMYPHAPEIEDTIPDPAKTYLAQANDTLHAPAGCVMLCASSVDAMLKNRDYIDGNLYSRIEKAAKEHVITKEMARWAHEVRLDANDQRHADENATLPTQQDAQRCIDFTRALAEFLFVLPSKIQRGLASSSSDS